MNLCFDWKAIQNDAVEAMKHIHFATVFYLNDNKKWWIGFPSNKSIAKFQTETYIEIIAKLQQK